jgi:hypothetical protein
MPGLLTHSPADIIRYLLTDLGLGSDSDTPNLSAWPVYESDEPPTPDDCITVYNTSDKIQGRSMIDGEFQGQEGFLIRIRSSGPVNGFSKAEAIKEAIDKQCTQVVVNLEGHSYRIPAINRTTGVLKLGQEVGVSNRYIYTINATAAIRQLT